MSESTLAGVPAQGLKHVIFDFGAVVFRWEPLALFRQVLPERTPDEATTRALVDRVFKGYTGTWGLFDQGLIDRDDLLPRLAEQSGLSREEVAAIVDAVPGHLLPMADSVALIDELQAAGHRLFFLSNMPHPYADHLERAHDVVQRFEDGVFSARVNRVKPNEDIFQLALKQFGVRAQDCVFLDDHPVNIAVAEGLGFTGIRFTTAAAARPLLRAAACRVAEA